MHDDELADPMLEAAARELRQPVPVRDAWRTSLLAALDDETPDPRVAHRGWTIQPWTALAAGIVLVVASAAVTVTVMKHEAPIPSTTIRAASVDRPMVRFTFVAPNAGHVAVVGDFNSWNPTASTLRRLGDGRTWTLEVPLSPGRYNYAFVVDGKLIRDPSAPQGDDDDFGVTNSVILVRNSIS